MCLINNMHKMKKTADTMDKSQLIRYFEFAILEHKESLQTKNPTLSSWVLYLFWVVHFESIHKSGCVISRDIIWFVH